MTSSPASNALNRSGSELNPAVGTLPGAVSTPQAPPGRRISFVAWGAAGVVSLAIYALIFKLA